MQGPDVVASAVVQLDGRPPAAQANARTWSYTDCFDGAGYGHAEEAVGAVE